MCAISFFYYYYFQNSGAPNDDFPLNALKTHLRLSRVLSISLQQVLHCRKDAVAKLEYAGRVLNLVVCGHIEA